MWAVGIGFIVVMFASSRVAAKEEKQPAKYTSSSSGRRSRSRGRGRKKYN